MAPRDRAVLADERTRRDCGCHLWHADEHSLLQPSRSCVQHFTADVQLLPCDRVQDHLVVRDRHDL